MGNFQRSIRNSLGACLRMPLTFPQLESFGGAGPRPAPGALARLREISTAKSCLAASLSQQFLHPHPRRLARLAVPFGGVRRFARSHESMSGALVDNRFVGLPQRLHVFLGARNRRVYARVVAAVKAVNRRLNTSHGILLGRRSVKNEG